MFSKVKNSLILFPFLFCVYPVLTLIAHNAAEMEMFEGLRALLLSLILTLAVYLVILVLTKSPIKTALITSLILLFFYSYGHVNFIARDWQISSFVIGRHRTLVPVYAFSFVIVTWLILRTKRELSPLKKFLNGFGFLLLIFPIFQLASYQVDAYNADKERIIYPTPSTAVSIEENDTPPDVYYILVDGYPRGDFIYQYFDSDNSQFLNKLEEIGFFIADCSQSNYTDTRFSMASTLNMVYLDEGTQSPEVLLAGSQLDTMIKSSAVQNYFSDLGYSIITFESGYKWLRWEDPDIHLEPAVERSNRRYWNLGINDFEKLMLETTAAKLLIDLPIVVNPDQTRKLGEILDNPRTAHRERVKYTLKMLPQLPDFVPGPKFVYAHIIFPHPPFIVDDEGNQIQNTPQDEISAYSDQIIYLNNQLLSIVDSLINSSHPDPIIIIQSDHGATLDYEGLNIDKANRLGILNAYYFPDEDSPDLYGTISPVNTFRIILDQYFQGNFGRLEDRSIVGKQSPFTKIDCIPLE